MRSIAVVLTIALVTLGTLSALPSTADDEPGPNHAPHILIPRLLNCTYTSRIPIIDGVISPNEWTVAERTEALWSEQPPAWEEKGSHITGPGIQNDSDCSHVFWSMYDADFLYFLFNCSDDNITVDSYPDMFWRDDGIEIAIDGAWDKDVDQRTDEGFEDGDTFAVPADGSDGIAYSLANGNQYARYWNPNRDWYSAVSQHVSNNSSYYVVEVMIRLSAVSNPLPATTIGLNTGQNDDDDGNVTKEGVMRWQGEDGHDDLWKNETLWGHLYFRTEVRADAGTSQVVTQGDEVAFDGSRSWGNHPDFRSRASYNWTFVYEGEEVTLTGEKPTFVFGTPGQYKVALNVTDGTGVYDTDTVTIGVRDTQDPVADAGEDITVDMGTLVVLDGSGSTDNHPDFPDCATFEWFFIDEDVFRLYGIVVQHTFHNPGLYNVRLTVTDPTGLNEDQDTVTVTVRDIEPPGADAGADVTVEDGQYVDFDGSNSTDNVGIVKATWEFYLGDDLVTLSGLTYPYQFPRPGSFTVTLTVYDGQGLNSTDVVNVTVLDITDPVANAGEVREFNEDVEVTLTAELSFDDVEIVLYEWNISLGETPIANRTGREVRYNFTQPGVYDITLTVTDGVGLTGQDTVKYSVLDVTRPEAEAGEDRSVEEDARVRLSGENSTDNVEVVDWSWVIESDVEPRVQRTGRDIEYVFATPGTYTVTLTCTDAEGNWDSDAATLTVLDVTPPTAVPPSSVKIKVGQTITLDGRASTDNVGVVRYVWSYDIGDVPYQVEGANRTQQFDAKGNYTITLTVEDARGNSDQATFHVLVKKPKDPDDGPGLGALAALVAIGGGSLVAARRRRGR